MTSRFRFISAHRAAYGVKRLSRFLAVSRSGFYCVTSFVSFRQARQGASRRARRGFHAGMTTARAVSAGRMTVEEATAALHHGVLRVFAADTPAKPIKKLDHNRG